MSSAISEPRATSSGAASATADTGAGSWIRLSLALAGRAVLRPRLAADLLRVAWRFRSRHWFKRFPFLPLPAPEYVHWRMHTAYGNPQAIPPVDDVIRYARWVAGRH